MRILTVLCKSGGMLPVFNNRVAYIDETNLHHGISEVGWKLDYRRFRVWLAEKYDIQVAKMFLGKVPGHDTIYRNLEDARFLRRYYVASRSRDK